MELFTYITIFFVSILFSINTRTISSHRLFCFFWLVTYVLLGVIVRTKYDSDIITYSIAMRQSNLSLYYIREPIIWIGQQYLYDILKSSFIVFLIFDFIAGLLLFRAFRNFDLPQYAYFSILLFFPFVLGMQNIYRQWFASILLIYSFSIVWKGHSTVRSLAPFLLSVLSHNAAAIFIPLLFIKNHTFFGKFKWYIGCVIALGGLIIGAGSKSSANTGSDLTLVYLFLIFLFIFLVPLLDKGVIKNSRKVDYKLLGLSLFLISAGILLLSSAGAERVAMFCLLIFYPILVLLLEERFSGSVLVRSMLSFFGFIPMLLFSVKIFIIY